MPAGGSETILLVEDEASVRDLARRMLEESGYQVLSATNGSDALQLCTANREHIDLMVTDVVMPQMRGAELARRVAHIRPGLPVLYMSGYTDNSIDPNISDSVSFLQKPFTLDELLGAVREALETVPAATRSSPPKPARDRSRRAALGSVLLAPPEAARVLQLHDLEHVDDVEREGERDEGDRRDRDRLPAGATRRPRGTG